MAREKNGVLVSYNTISALKKDIDNITSWLNVKANSVAEAFEKFPLLEKKYDEINGVEKLKHIIICAQ
jgi:hypothetical protein